MPRPPILPQIDWPLVFDQGLEYADWLRAAENPAHADKMEAERARLQLEPTEIAWLQGLTRKVHVIAIAEDWCGDVHRHAPVLAALATDTQNLLVRFIARADFPEIFARFLTNGGEAIPKFIFLNDQFVETGNWGPMPAKCRELIARGKALGDVGLARKRVSALYEADEARRDVVRELLELIEIASTSIL
jgi:thiol-disulfide isomerase/thioredoxin